MKKKNGKESAVFHGLSINCTKRKESLFFHEGKCFLKPANVQSMLGFFRLTE